MRILVFSAHPDDAEFALGGTLALLAKRHELVMAVMTDGSAGSYGDTKTRKKEQEAAAELLGAKLLWQGLPDTSLEHDRKHTLQVAQIIRDVQPELILSNWWGLSGDVLDGRAHPEHRIMGLLVRDGARYARFGVSELTAEKHKTHSILWYMVGSREARIAVPVDSVLDTMQKLWDCHKSQTQLRGSKLIEFLTLQRRAQAEHYPDAKYVEFLGADKPVSIDLARELGGW